MLPLAISIQSGEAQVCYVYNAPLWVHLNKMSVADGTASGVLGLRQRRLCGLQLRDPSTTPVPLQSLLPRQRSMHVKKLQHCGRHCRAPVFLLSQTLATRSHVLLQQQEKTIEQSKRRAVKTRVQPQQSLPKLLQQWHSRSGRRSQKHQSCTHCGNAFTAHSERLQHDHHHQQQQQQYRIQQQYSVQQHFHHKEVLEQHLQHGRSSFLSREITAERQSVGLRFFGVASIPSLVCHRRAARTGAMCEYYAAGAVARALGATNGSASIIKKETRVLSAAVLLTSRWWWWWRPCAVMSYYAASLVAAPINVYSVQSKKSAGKTCGAAVSRPLHVRKSTTLLMGACRTLGAAGNNAVPALSRFSSYTSAIAAKRLVGLHFNAACVSSSTASAPPSAPITTARVFSNPKILSFRGFSAATNAHASSCSGGVAAVGVVPSSASSLSAAVTSAEGSAACSTTTAAASSISGAAVAPPTAIGAGTTAATAATGPVGGRTPPAAAAAAPLAAAAGAREGAFQVEYVPLVIVGAGLTGLTAAHTVFSSVAGSSMAAEWQANYRNLRGECLPTEGTVAAAAAMRSSASPDAVGASSPLAAAAAAMGPASTMPQVKRRALANIEISEEGQKYAVALVRSTSAQATVAPEGFLLADAEGTTCSKTRGYSAYVTAAPAADAAVSFIAGAGRTAEKTRAERSGRRCETQEHTSSVVVAEKAAPAFFEGEKRRQQTMLHAAAKETPGIGSGVAAQPAPPLVMIVESRDRVGGCLYTRKCGDYIVDCGANSFRLTSDTVTLLQQLQLLPRLRLADSKLKRYICWKGKLHASPLDSISAFYSSRILSFSGKLRLLAGLCGLIPPQCLWKYCSPRNRAAAAAEAEAQAEEARLPTKSAVKNTKSHETSTSVCSTDVTSSNDTSSSSSRNSSRCVHRSSSAESIVSHFSDNNVLSESHCNNISETQQSPHPFSNATAQEKYPKKVTTAFSRISSKWTSFWKRSSEEEKREHRHTIFKETDETVEAFVARRLGWQMQQRVVDAIISGVCAGDARQLSMRAAMGAAYAPLKDGVIVFAFRSLWIFLRRALFERSSRGSLLSTTAAETRQVTRATDNSPSFDVNDRKKDERVPAAIANFDGGMGVLIDGLLRQLPSVIEEPRRQLHHSTSHVGLPLAAVAATGIPQYELLRTSVLPGKVNTDTRNTVAFSKERRSAVNNNLHNGSTIRTAEATREEAPEEVSAAGGFTAATAKAPDEKASTGTAAATAAAVAYCGKTTHGKTETGIFEGAPTEATAVSVGVRTASHIPGTHTLVDEECVTSRGVATAQAPCVLRLGWSLQEIQLLPAATAATGRLPMHECFKDYGPQSVCSSSSYPSHISEPLCCHQEVSSVAGCYTSSASNAQLQTFSDRRATPLARSCTFPCDTKANANYSAFSFAAGAAFSVSSSLPSSSAAAATAAVTQFALPRPADVCGAGTCDGDTMSAATAAAAAALVATRHLKSRPRYLLRFAAGASWEPTIAASSRSSSREVRAPPPERQETAERLIVTDNVLLTVPAPDAARALHLLLSAQLRHRLESIRAASIIIVLLAFNRQRLMRDRHWSEKIHSCNSSLSAAGGSQPSSATAAKDAEHHHKPLSIDTDEHKVRFKVESDAKGFLFSSSETLHLSSSVYKSRGGSKSSNKEQWEVHSVGDSLNESERSTQTKMFGFLIPAAEREKQKWYSLGCLLVSNLFEERLSLRARAENEELAAIFLGGAHQGEQLLSQSDRDLGLLAAADLQRGLQQAQQQACCNSSGPSTDSLHSSCSSACSNRNSGRSACDRENGADEPPRKSSECLDRCSSSFSRENRFRREAETQSSAATGSEMLIEGVRVLHVQRWHNAIPLCGVGHLDLLQDLKQTLKHKLRQHEEQQQQQLEQHKKLQHQQESQRTLPREQQQEHLQMGELIVEGNWVSEAAVGSRITAGMKAGRALAIALQRQRRGE